MHLGEISLRARFLLNCDVVVNCEEKHQGIEYSTKFVTRVQSIPVASLVMASSDNTLKGIEPMDRNRIEG